MTLLSDSTRLIAMVAVMAGLSAISFGGAWNGFQTDDYGLAYRFVDEINATVSGPANLVHRLLVSTLGGDKIHWTPITNLATYLTLEDDTLTRVVGVNMLLVLCCGLATFVLGTELGIHRLAAAIAAAWICTSQALVFATTSIWGPMNLLAPLFGILSALMLWRWMNARVHAEAPVNAIDRHFILFVFFFILALLSKEAEIRGFLLIAVIGGLLIWYRRDRFSVRAVLVTLSVISAVIVAYFALRYFLTDAKVPLLRAVGEAETTYHYPRLDLATTARNAGQLMIGAANPLNNYEAYLAARQHAEVRLVLLLIPAVLVLGSIAFAWTAAVARGSKPTRLRMLFCLSLVIASLFPEALLGKVSEVYAMSSVWPLALLGAVTVDDACTRDPRLSPYAVALACVLVGANVISSHSKTSQLVTTGDYARSMRSSMQEISDSLGSPGRIALIYSPRSGDAFGPFGETGVYASGFKPRFTPHKWIPIARDGAPVSLCDFDLVLEETADRRKVVISDIPARLGCGAH